MKAEVEYLVGVKTPVVEPWEPFADPILDFFETLSFQIRKLRNDMEEANETAAFGFWLRRTHMEEYRKRYADGLLRLGRGLIFHIPASNVPVLFAYSLAIGLLAGNSCSVRISSRCHNQDEWLCRLMDSLLMQPEYRKIRKRISVFSCEKENEIVRSLLERCDGSIVWGGDQTIKTMRKLPVKPDSVQLMFPDRYSICILDAYQLERATEEELKNLVCRFYKDTYAVDQNACSSPRFVLWNTNNSTKLIKDIQDRWWNLVFQESSRYVRTDHKAVIKYETLCLQAMTSEDIKEIKWYENLLYVVCLSRIPKHPEKVKGSCGLFFQYEGEWETMIKKMAVSQLQTVTLYGISKKVFTKAIVRNHLQGIHRVVPVGQSMDMDLIWDGKDTINMLSRQIYGR